MAREPGSISLGYPNRVTTLLERAQLKAIRALTRATMAPMPERSSLLQFGCTVRAVESPAPQVRRIHLEAPQFADYQPNGPDEYFALLMPQAGAPLDLPANDHFNVRTSLAAMPADQRPDLRWYTIRRLDRATSSIAVDIVTHGTGGPGSAWALAARAGDPAGFRQGTALHLCGEDARQCLVVDETGAPGLAAIIEAGRVSDASALIVEASDTDHLTPLPAHPGLRVVLREGRPPGAAALAELRSLSPEAYDYFYLCGESSLATGCRRFLVKESDVDRRRILFSGYWKLGQSRT